MCDCWNCFFLCTHDSSTIDSLYHRLDRVLRLSSSRRNWAPPPLHPPASVPLPLFGSGGGAIHSVAERGWGSPNSDEGDILWSLYMFALCGLYKPTATENCKYKNDLFPVRLFDYSLWHRIQDVIPLLPWEKFQYQSCNTYSRFSYLSPKGHKVHIEDYICGDDCINAQYAQYDIT